MNRKVVLMASIFLVLALGLVVTPAAAAVELYYDDNEWDGYLAYWVGWQLAVKFSLPTGWTGARILTARYYIHSAPNTFTVHVYDSDRMTDLIPPFSVTPTTTGWFDVPISPPVEVSDDFYIVIEYEIDVQPFIGADEDAPIDFRSYYRDPLGVWTLLNHDWMIRAVVEPIPVGGVLVPTNKFELLAPWIGLASLIIVPIASILYVKHRKKKQT